MSELHKFSQLRASNFTHFTRSHHHTTTDSVQRIRSDTSTSGDSPAEQEGGEEVTLKRTNENNRLDGVVHAEVQTTVDNYTKNGGHETTVETSNTIGSEGLLVDIDETVELTVTTLLGVLSIIGKTGTGIVERVDEEERSSTGSLFLLLEKFSEVINSATYTAGGQVAHHPLKITITLLLEGEHGLVGITESEVKGLGGEVTDNVGSVTSP